MVGLVGSPETAFCVVIIRGRVLGKMDHWPKCISYTHYINSPGVAKYISQILGFAFVLSSTLSNSM